MEQEKPPFLLKEAESMGRYLSMASEKMNKRQINDGFMSETTEELERFNNRFKEAGYDHTFAAVVANEAGLSELVQVPPNRAEHYFEIPPGTAILPLFNELMSGKDHNITRQFLVAEAFFYLTAVGIKPEKTKVLFKTILESGEQLHGLKAMLTAVLNGVYEAPVSRLKRYQRDSTSTLRVDEIMAHFSYISRKAGLKKR